MEWLANVGIVYKMAKKIGFLRAAQGINSPGLASRKNHEGTYAPEIALPSVT